jgi:threonine dehydrogenase-like Zn-dependent dehydrogenase
MATMPAAMYVGERTVIVKEIPVPDVGPHQVRLEVSHCGICGTDLHMVMDGWGRPNSVGGHEYSGVVVEVGAEVTGWALGDRVVGGPGAGCGQCGPCLRGDTNLCRSRPRSGVDAFTGAFARYKVNSEDALFGVPAGVDLRTAALTEPLAVAVRGVRRASPEPADRVLVTGGGPIGLLTVAVLRNHGVTDVTVSEPNPRRRDLAMEMGAAQVIAPDALVEPRLPMDRVAAPFQAAIECSGRAAAMEAALANLDVGGTLVLSGAGMHRPRLDPNRIILNELQVTGSVEYTTDDYRLALLLLAENKVPVASLLEPEDQPLSRLQWAIEQLVAGELAGKVMVVPDA